MTDYAGLPRRIMELLYAHPDIEVSASHMLDIDPGLPRNSHNVRLKRMETDGYVSSRVRKIPGERNRPRRFYKLTTKGLDELTYLRKNFGIFPSRGGKYDVIPVEFPNALIAAIPNYQDRKLATIENLEKHKLRYARLIKLMPRLPRSSENEMLPSFPRATAKLFRELGQEDFDGNPKAFDKLDLSQINTLLFHFIELCFKNSEEVFRSLQPDELGLLPSSSVISPKISSQAVPAPTTPTDLSEQKTKSKLPDIIEKYMQTVERHRQEERALLADINQLRQETGATVDQSEPPATKPISVPKKSSKKKKSHKK